MFCILNSLNQKLKRTYRISSPVYAKLISNQESHLLTCARSSISLGPATEPGSAVSLLTYQVRLEAGTEAGERHEAVTVSPTEYLRQRSYLELATDLREEPSHDGTVKLREGLFTDILLNDRYIAPMLSSYREETPRMVGPDLGRSVTK